MPGHEYDRHVHSALLDLLLKGEAAFATQPDIENQATRRVVLREGKKILRRFECLHMQANRTQQPVEGKSY
ncbi:hypothetical protein D3C80_1764850 [compost metagenome]